MSTDQATATPDTRQRSKCFMCGGTFVSHSEYQPVVQCPKNICLWCYSRKDLHDRYMAMFHALQIAVKTHPKTCTGKCCVTARAARRAYKVGA